LILAPQIERPPLEPGSVEPARGGGVRADEDLAYARERRQSRGGVDGVPECGEVLDVPHTAPDEAATRVHGAPSGIHGSARRSRIRPSSARAEPMGVGGVVAAGEAGDEEGDRAVADELVDDAVPLVDHLGGRSGR
jgi:hypothetical protein